MSNKPAGDEIHRQDPAATLSIYPTGLVDVTLHDLERRMFDRLPGRVIQLPGNPPAWVKYVVVVEANGGKSLTLKAFTHEPPATQGE